MESLHDTLRTTNQAAIAQAIKGLGGIGKTQTAIEYAYRYEQDYTAILWAIADTEVSLRSSYVELVGLLELPEREAQEEEQIVKALITWLKSNNNWLMIFDNADDPGLIKPYLPHNHKGSVLLTSRANKFDVIGVVKPLSLDVMSPDDALAFLLKRTGNDDRTDIAAQEMSAATEIVSELGYLPLAIEQAGAYITELTCKFTDYRTAFHNSKLALLNSAKPIIGEYPESVATTWLMNFTQVEQQSLASAELLRASAFLHPDNIPLELIIEGDREWGAEIHTALAASPDKRLGVLALLKPLLAYSLINREPREIAADTYSVHRLVQAVVRAELETEPCRQWAGRVVKALNAVFPVVEYQHWGRIERLLLHSKAGAELIAAYGCEFVEAGRLLNQLAYYCVERAVYEEAEPHYQRALQITEAALGAAHPSVATTLNNLAGLYEAQGKYEEAEPLYLRDLQITEAALGAAHPSVATTLNNLAELYRAQGKYEEAEPHYQRAIKIIVKVLGREHPYFKAGVNNYYLMLIEMGKEKDAPAIIERLLLP